MHQNVAKMEQESVNQRIKILQNKLAMDVNEFSSAIETHPGTVYRVLRNDYVPSKKMLNKMVSTFGLSRLWLTDGTGEMFATGSEADNIARIKAAQNGEVAPQNDFEKLYEKEKQRADLAEKNNAVLLRVLSKFLDSEQLANFLQAPEELGKVAKLRVVGK